VNGIEPESTQEGPEGAKHASGSRDETIAACRGDLGGIFKTLGMAVNTAVLTLDLTLAQMRCLMVLGKQEEAQPVGRIAAILKVSEPTASQLVERLVQRGLAGRAVDPADRRRTLVSLTDVARVRIDSLRDEREETVLAALARLDDEQLEALSVGLRALSAACTVMTGAGTAPAQTDRDAEQAGSTE
jgi:DNA-binding MarR family transcriptional regulator